MRQQPAASRGASSTGRIGCAEPFATSTTDERGWFRAGGLAPGRTCLEATRAGFAPARLDDLVLADRAVRVVTLQAERGVALRGTLKTAGPPAQPVAGAAVALRCGTAEEPLARAETGDGGRFDLGLV
nr:carboxypeptidase-like regulatory domain-containing protein [Acidobacteriota bacterium]